ncbi:MAG: LPS export ABC transporter periplasmic protein LptC [Thermodesulfobacteriota bacterium]
MNRKIKVGLTAFIVLSVAALALLVALRYRSENRVTVTFNENKDIEVKIEKIHYSGNRDGRLEWELKADSATRTRGDGLAAFETVSFVYYTAEGDRITLEAPRGSYDEARGVIDASGGVTVSSSSGYTVRSESMRYSVGSREITSGSRVEIASGTMEVSGIGFLVEVDRGRLRLMKDVEAVIREAAI